MKKYLMIASLTLGSLLHAGERLDRCPEFKQWIAEQVEAHKDSALILEEAKAIAEKHVQAGYLTEEEIFTILEEVEAYLGN